MLLAVKRALKISGLVLLVLLALLIASVWEPDRSVESLSARWAPPPSQFVELEGLSALLKQLQVSRCVLVGNSYGGRLAWEFAVAHPETVGRLVLVDASGYPRNSTSVPLGFRIAATPGLRRFAEVLLPRGLIERSVKNVYGDPSKVTPELVDRYFELTLREGNRVALGRRMDQVRDGDVSKLSGLMMPTLILWGGQDRLIPPENARRFDADIPNSRLVMFDALGHVPHEEDPTSTVAELERFLAEP